MERKRVTGPELFKLLQPMLGLEGRNIKHLVLTLEINKPAEIQILENVTVLDSDSEKWKCQKFNLCEAVETVEDGTDNSTE